MLCLYQSNRLEYLAEALATLRCQPTAAPLWQPEEVIIQSQGMRRYLNQFLARQSGIAANIHYTLPATFSWRLLRTVLPDAPALNPFHPQVLHWRLLALFQSAAFRQPEWAVVQDALAGYLASSNTAAYHLAAQLADVFDQYLVYRPDWIAAWQQNRLRGLGEDETWQAALWRHLDDGQYHGHRVTQWQTLLQRLNGEHLPARLLVFGIAALAPIYLQLLEAVAQHTEVHVFALNPSCEHWGNVLPAAQILHLDNGSAEASGHPLLASLGKQGRDFFDALAAMPNVRHELSIYDDAPPQHTLLNRLQFDIQTLRLPEPPSAAPNGDASIQFVAAHSPLRELHILKDQLLHDLAAHPDWQPHNIAVLTPNIEPYLPFINAVFGHSQGGNQALPYSVADVKISRHQPLLQLLEQWLLWVGSRCEIDYLLPMLDSPVLRNRFELSETDVTLLRHALAEQGIRWGSDAAMRCRYGGTDSAFTWQQGRERTVLGWLLPQTDAPQTWQGRLPWYADINHTPLLARAQTLLDTLLAQHAHWQQPATVAVWLQRLRHWLANVTDADTRAGDAMRQLETALTGWGEQAILAGFDDTLTPALATEHIRHFLDSSDDAGLLRGGITFCSMVPMRSLPFKCVCLLGLNDGDYPRTTHAAAFDLIARHPRGGDRARRDDDRYLFLESILSAREKLYLSYIGKDIRKNETLAPSALLNELIDTLAAMVDTAADDFAAQHVCQHPLQPFSSQYFHSAFISTRQDYAAALSQPAATAEPFYQTANSQPATALKVDIEPFIAFWRNPLRAWLQQELGWREPYRQSQWDAKEPFTVTDPAALNRFYLQARRHNRNFADADALLKQMNALPEDLFGAKLAEPHRSGALALDADLLHSPARPNAECQFGYDGIVLSGSLNHLHHHGQIIYAHQKPNGPQQLAWRLRHLIFCAADVPGIAHDTHILHPTEPQHLQPIEAGQARALLERWLDAWRLGQNRPLPFFARTSLAAARAWHKTPDMQTPPEAARMAAHKTYRHDDDGRSHGQEDDTEVALVFGRDDTLPTETDLFWRLVGDLLRPLLAYTDSAAGDNA